MILQGAKVVSTKKQTSRPTRAHRTVGREISEQVSARRMCSSHNLPWTARKAEIILTFERSRTAWWVCTITWPVSSSCWLKVARTYRHTYRELPLKHRLLKMRLIRAALSQRCQTNWTFWTRLLTAAQIENKPREDKTRMKPLNLSSSAARQEGIFRGRNYSIHHPRATLKVSLSAIQT